MHIKDYETLSNEAESFICLDFCKLVKKTNITKHTKNMTVDKTSSVIHMLHIIAQLNIFHFMKLLSSSQVQSFSYNMYHTYIHKQFRIKISGCVILRDSGLHTI
jgi:hypothetical protein